MRIYETMWTYGFILFGLLATVASAQRGGGGGGGRTLSEDSVPDSCRRRLQSNFFQTGGQSSYGCVLHEPLENRRTQATDFCMTCRFPYFYTNDQVKDQIRTSTVDALRLERNRFNTDSSLTFVVNGTDDVYDFMSIFARDARNRDIYNALDGVYYFFRNGSIGLASYNEGMQQGDIDCETCRTINGRDMIDLPRSCTNAELRSSGDGSCVLHEPERSSSSRGMPPYNRNDDSSSRGTEYCITCKFYHRASDADTNNAIQSLAGSLNNELQPDDRLFFVFDPAHKKYDLRDSLKNYRNVIFKTKQAFHFFPNGSVNVQTWHGAGAVVPDSDRGGGNRNQNNRNRDNSGRDYNSNDNNNRDSSYNNNNNRDYITPTITGRDRSPRDQPSIITRGRYDYDQSPTVNNYNNRNSPRGGYANTNDALNDAVIRPTQTRDTYYSYTPNQDTYSPTIGIYTQTRFGQQIPSNRDNRDEINFSDQQRNSGSSPSPRDQQPPSCSARVVQISANGICNLHQSMTGDSPSLLARQAVGGSNKKYFCITCRPLRQSSRRDIEDAIDDLTRNHLMRNQEFLSAATNDNGKLVVVINAAQEYFSLRDIVRSHPQIEYALDRAIFLFANGSSAVTRYSTATRSETGSYGPDIQYTRSYSTDRREEQFTLPIAMAQMGPGPVVRNTRQQPAYDSVNNNNNNNIARNTRYDDGTGSNNDFTNSNNNNNNNNVVISTITVDPQRRNGYAQTVTVTVPDNTNQQYQVRPTAYVPQFGSNVVNPLGSTVDNNEEQTVCFVVRKGQRTGRAGIYPGPDLGGSVTNYNSRRN